MYLQLEMKEKQGWEKKLVYIFKENGKEIAFCGCRAGLCSTACGDTGGLQEDPSFSPPGRTEPLRNPRLNLSVLF